MDDIDSAKDTPEDEAPKAPAREVVKGADGSEGRVYVIPHPNLPTFEERFAKLVKRATKLGVEVPTYTNLRQEPKVIKETTDDTDPETGRPLVVERVIMMHHIAVFHPQVVVSGWEFMAKLEHTEEGNILHVLEGKEIPFKYRDCEAWCDHCKTRRYRKDTFILRSTTNTDEWQQVGRNCLADFLGRDAERYADAAELYYTTDAVGSASEMYDGEGGGGGGTHYVMLDRYLGYVAEVISHVGWKSKSSAFKWGGQATAEIALHEMFKRKFDPRSDLFREPTEKSFEVGKTAIEWADALTDEDVSHSDYLWNIRVIARRGVVDRQQFGFAASIVSSYQRHIGELEMRTRINVESHWVGEVGERRIFNLLVEKVIEVGGGDYAQFPAAQLHIMSDDDGNKFIWFAHGTTLDTGKKVMLKGSIKAHKEREGVKQTLLTRCEEVIMKDYLVVYQGNEYRFQAPDPKEARKLLPGVLDVAKAPRGIKIVEEGAPDTTALAEESILQQPTVSSEETFEIQQPTLSDIPEDERLHVQED